MATDMNGLHALDNMINNLSISYFPRSCHVKNVPDFHCISFGLVVAFSGFRIHYLHEQNNEIVRQ